MDERSASVAHWLMPCIANNLPDPLRSLPDDRNAINAEVRGINIASEWRTPITCGIQRCSRWLNCPR